MEPPEEAVVAEDSSKTCPFEIIPTTLTALPIISEDEVAELLMAILVVVVISALVQVISQ